MSDSNKYASESLESRVAENSTPDDTGGINIRGYIKIYDAESGEVYVDSGDA